MRDLTVLRLAASTLSLMVAGAGAGLILAVSRLFA